MGSETAKAGKLDKGVMKVLMAVGGDKFLGCCFDLVSFLLAV
jgi:hypothetical protein